MRYVFFLLGLLIFRAEGRSSEQDPVGYVSVELNGQFGNQLFQIATAYAYALDHNLALTIPDLVRRQKDNIPKNAKEVFHAKIDSYDIPSQIQLKWTEPNFNYTAIPPSTTVELHGFFQSEKYFKHRKDEILSLFAPPEGMNERILMEYPFLSSDSLVVGIQIRDYRREQPQSKQHPTVGRSYYESAMACFPEDTIFLVSSNNLSYAKECVEGLSSNIVYLPCGPNYIEEFYTLVLCKSFIISNSTFGWWAAWLCTSPDKVVITPSPWFTLPFDNTSMRKDLLPKGWRVVTYRNGSNHR